MIDWPAFDDLFLVGLALYVATVAAMFVIFRLW